jgi:hypothetical protein
MPYTVPRVQVLPLPDDQLSFQVEGVERLRWHFAPRYPRPFFYPLLGPSGLSLSRMGHPAAPDHDHHRSLWLGHQNIQGVNFWEERGGSQQIRQETWLHYQDGADEAGMVVRLGFFDAHKVRLLSVDLIAVFRPLPNRETWLELQLRLTPELDKLTLGKTNFGLLGLRVAAPLSTHYGAGLLTSSAGRTGEKANFAREAAWMDYSGPIVGETIEGITWFDHRSNPNYPASWHVREDGWMSPALCLREPLDVLKTSPVTLRYALHLHAGAVDADAATARHRDFLASAPWEVVAARPPWRLTLRRKK